MQKEVIVSMPAYVSIPKDLNNVKSKVIYGLTKRQCICFSLAACIGVPLFLTLQKIVSNDIATLVMMVVVLPLFLLAMYEKHGIPLERIILQRLKVMYIKPNIRTYRTHNYYAALIQKALFMEKEVSRNAKEK